MARGDLQIGDTWTHPDHRGKGIAGFAVHTILAAMSRLGRHFWYVVEEINTPSIKAAEGAGMTLYGRGVWIRPFNIKLIGSYVIREEIASDAPFGRPRGGVARTGLASGAERAGG
jgi:GNAT superfamily N-acetyltransferase